MINDLDADGGAQEPPEDAHRRYHAAIGTIETLALNMRTIRRGRFPLQAKRRIREILRLSAEVQEILQRELAREGKP